MLVFVPYLPRGIDLALFEGITVRECLVKEETSQLEPKAVIINCFRLGTEMIF
jgi:hypothetical protein